MENISGIILAGGKSSRFKSPKYLAKLGDQTLLEIAVGKLKSFCNEIMVVSKNEIATLPTVARNDDGDVIARSEATRQSIKNVIEKSGEFHPLIGIIEGLRNSQNQANLVMAVDMPFITKKLISKLLNSCRAGSPNTPTICLYRYKDRPEPFFGLYRKSCLPIFIDFLHSRLPTPDSRLNGRIIDIIEKCNHQYINIEEDRMDFFNINTKEDLNEAQRLIKSNPKLLGN